MVRAAFGAIGGGGSGRRAGERRHGRAGAHRPARAARRPPRPRPAGGHGGEPSTGGFIQADPATNSLIITAPEPLYKQVRALIDQLDTRRAQVYIESLIVELAGNDAAEFGFQWQGLFGQSGDKYGVVTGTNFRQPGRPEHHRHQRRRRARARSTWARA